MKKILNQFSIYFELYVTSINNLCSRVSNSFVCKDFSLCFEIITALGLFILAFVFLEVWINLLLLFRTYRKGEIKDKHFGSIELEDVFEVLLLEFCSGTCDIIHTLLFWVSCFRLERKFREVLFFMLLKFLKPGDSMTLASKE